MTDTTKPNFFEFPRTVGVSAPVQHARNEVCLRGHLNETLEAVLASNEPDAIFQLLGELANKAIDIAFEASRGMPGHVTQLRELVTKSQTEAPEENSSPARHFLQLGFLNKADAHRGIAELEGMLREDVFVVPSVGKVVLLADGTRGIETNGTLQVIDEGARVYTDPRGVFQAASLHLPVPDLYMLAFGSDYSSWRECDADTPGARPFWSETSLRNYRDERGNVREALEARRALAREGK